jgi:hypothetical protein
MPYFGNTLLNPSIFVGIKHNSSTPHAIFWQYVLINFRTYIVITKVYCQNMACGVLELCLIATKIEGFKRVLPKYGMLCTRIVLNCNKICTFCFPIIILKQKAVLRQVWQ